MDNIATSGHVEVDQAMASIRGANAATFSPSASNHFEIRMQHRAQGLTLWARTYLSQVPRDGGIAAGLPGAAAQENLPNASHLGMHGETNDPMGCGL